nr:MAG TPA: hypothetical protein [Herelleviridae sp.]
MPIGLIGHIFQLDKIVTVFPFNSLKFLFKPTPV